MSYTHSVFINPETNEVYKEGEILKRPKLAETLEVRDCMKTKWNIIHFQLKPYKLSTVTRRVVR